MDCIHEKWTVTPISSPPVVKHCSGCGHDSRFVSSNLFRMNGNGGLYDVWLIYKCVNCKTTWKLAILSRVRLYNIERRLFNAFIDNDLYTALMYAFDKQTHEKNRTTPMYEEISYSVDRQTESICGQECVIEIITQFPLRIKLCEVLSEQLSISRTKIRKLMDSGDIKADNKSVNSKTLLIESVKLVVPKCIVREQYADEINKKADSSEDKNIWCES